MSAETVAIPDNTKVFVTVIEHDDLSLLGIPSRSQQQLEALEQFFAAVSAIDDELLTDEDFAELESNRVNFTREFDVSQR